MLVDIDGNPVNNFYEDTANRFTPNDDKEYIGGALVDSDGNAANNFYEDTANRFTPEDGKEYVGGVLVDSDGNEVNSFYEDLLNRLTPNDGKEYVDGVLVDSAPSGGGADGDADYTNAPPPSGGGGSSAPVEEIIAVEEEVDPCPEGYMMDPETKTCVIDPFQTPFAEAPVMQPSLPAPTGAAYTGVNPLMALPTLAPGPQSGFAVPTPTIQPITVGQQGLASLPVRNG